MLAPPVVTTLYDLLKYRCKVSPRAEVDLCPNLVFGRDCVVGSFTKIKALSGPVTFGDRCGIANFCFIASGEAGIRIGNNLICGPSVNIVGINYQYHEKNKHLDDLGTTSKGITIGDNVWIGAGTTITDGARIGDNTIVVANSLVNRQFDGDEILQGIPAKSILKR